MIIAQGSDGIKTLLVGGDEKNIRLVTHDEAAWLCLLSAKCQVPSQASIINRWSLYRLD